MEKRRLSAIMFTDIVGYTKKMGDDEVKMLKLLREHNLIVENATGQHDGEIIKRVGDAFLVRFESALNAVLCAIEVQTALREYNKGKTESDQVHIRIGIHLGDIVISEGDVFGDGVNVASRIEPLAHPGGICITRSVYDIVKKKMTVKAVELGPQQLKNVDEAVEVFHLLSETVGIKELRKAKRLKKMSHSSLTPYFISGLIVIIVVLLLLQLSDFVLTDHIDTFQTQLQHRQITFVGDASFPILAPDGKSFVYFHDEKVVVQDISGNESIDLISLQQCFSLRWSPDGSEILITGTTHEAPNEIETVILSRLGGSQRKVGVFGRNAWSPDGKKIAFGRLPSNKICVVDKATGDVDSIITNEDYKWFNDIDWSPSGKFILFSTFKEDISTIRTISIDGEIEHVVVADSTASIRAPRWSPRGDAIYYLIKSDGVTDFKKIKIDAKTGDAIGKSSTVMTGLQCGGSYSISSGGDELLYTRETSFSNIWTIRITSALEGKHMRTNQLTNGTSNILSLSISPDGKQFAYSFVRSETNANVFVMPVEGGKSKQITHLSSPCDEACWSPDGLKIAFKARREDELHVWTVSINDGKLHEYKKTTPSSFGGGLSWTTDNRILYQKPGNRNYIVLDPTTENERDLILNDSVGWISDPKFSPDLKKLAVFWNRHPMRGLWITPVADSLREDLAEPIIEGSVFPIGWSQDSKEIFAYDARETNERKGILFISYEDGAVNDSLDLPFDDAYVTTASSDGNTFGCLVLENKSDVWIVRNFDPEVN